MRITLVLLVLLGIADQAIALSAVWYELGAMLRGEESLDVVGTAAIFLPSVLGFGGAALARSLHRRRSGWAWVVAWVPLILLGLALGLAAVFWVSPMGAHH